MKPGLLTIAALSTAALVLGCGRGVDGETAGYAKDSIGSAGGHAASPSQAEPAPSLATRTTVAAAPAEIAARDEIAVAPTSLKSAVRQSSSTLQTPGQMVAGSMLIRRGNASIRVDSLELAITRVHEVARRVSGIVANTNVQTGNEEVPSASIELRIPSDRFDEAVNGLRPIGKVESVNVSVEDVGEEFVDVTARMGNARRLEQRLIEVLANRTGKLADVLAVERELARVREEIERYEGRIRYLRERVAVSTLVVSVHEPPPLVADRPGQSPIREAFKQAWRNFVGLIAAIIASLGVVIPLGALLVTGFFVWRRYSPALKPAGAGPGQTQ